jgi:hypothetical protein
MFSVFCCVSSLLEDFVAFLKCNCHRLLLLVLNSLDENYVWMLLFALEIVSD